MRYLSFGKVEYQIELYFSGVSKVGLSFVDGDAETSINQLFYLAEYQTCNRWHGIPRHLQNFPLKM